MAAASCPLYILNEEVKQEVSVRRSAGGFRVELGGEERPGDMLHPLVGVVVHVDKQRHPAGRQRVVVHGKAMVL